MKTADTNGSTRAYSQLESELRTAILSGQLAGGQPICPEAELSQKYGIGRNSVRRALDNLVGTGLLRKVKGSGTFVVPAEERIHNDTAAAVKTILFLTCPPCTKADSFARINDSDPIATTIAHVVRSRGYEFIMTHVDASFTPPACLRERMVSGVIFRGNMDPDFWRNYISDLPNIGIQNINPALLTHWVKEDHFSLCYQAVAHLVELGHRHIGFVSDEIDMPISTERFLGFMGALRQFGLPFRQEYCAIWQREMVNGVLQVEFTMPDYSERLRRTFHHRKLPNPTAFVCVDDWRAICTINGLGKLGFSVPGDISITGVSMGGQFCVGGLGISSVSIRLADICFAAAEYLMEIILSSPRLGKSTILLRPEFYRGDTTAPVADTVPPTADPQLYREMADEFIRNSTSTQESAAPFSPEAPEGGNT